LDAGDEIIGVFISGAISGTYDSACIAKQTLGSDSLHIVDSRTATAGIALLLMEAAKQRDAGCSASQIAEHVSAISPKVRILAAINTLKYLRMGGRVSAATAIVGEFMGMKPLMSIIDGTVQSIGKARGMPAAINAMLQKALSDLPDLRYGVAFAHSCAPELAQKAIDCMKSPLKLAEWITCSIGSVIGSYTGRGVVGLAYIAK
jgi:DegV family protein with EDD domain